MKLKSIEIDNSAIGYMPSQELVYAAEVAYALKRPLLLSGEPGTGKTDFAKWVAHTLSLTNNFYPEPLVFATKSISTAQDLFYYYDAVAQFRDANLRQHPDDMHPLSKNTRDYIELKALGLAFERAMGRSILQGHQSSEQARGTVVLIDEIDKAPRDFPNDLLNEIEQYRFQIREINKEVHLNEEEKRNIFVILTSNFEKNLPEAFLRRCVYFHITFPNDDRLLQIVEKRLQLNDNDSIDKIRKRIREFFILRKDENMQKKPSTAEFLDYVRILREDHKLDSPLFDDSGKATKEAARYLSLLLKKKEDLDLYMP